MSYWFESDIAAFVAALLLSCLMIPQIIKVAQVRKLYDDNSPRKIHKGVIPRLGGIAFYPSTLFAICLVMAVNMSFATGNLSANTEGEIKALLYLVCSGMLLFFIGMADDMIGMGYKVKLAVQIVSGILIACSGTDVSSFSGLLGIEELPLIVSWPLTVFIAVYMINAINFIDGIDGLATGLSMIALAFYGVVLFHAEDYLSSMLACATFGTLTAFFFFNVLGRSENWTKTFMGDAGSMTIGLILAFLGLRICELQPGKTIDNFNPILLAFSPVIIPVFDVVRVILHRLKLHASPFVPTNVHIHHKLLALGYSQHVTLGVILSSSIVLLCANIVLGTRMSLTWLILGDIVVWTVVNIFLTRAIRAREIKLGQQKFK